MSHSFTGYEVGYFRKSQKTRQHIDEGHTIERLIISIAMLGDIPDTVSDIEGIGISEEHRFLVHPERAAEAGDAQKDPFLKLLLRIDSILDRLDPTDRTADRRRQEYDEYADESKSFYQDLRKVMSSLPLRGEMPKTKLTLRLPEEPNSTDMELSERVIVLCCGPTAGILEKAPSDQCAPWTEFSAQIGPEDIALTWNDALISLITSAVAGDFANSDPLFFSFDRKRLFRLFVSKSTTFFDRTRELDIYVVEVLRYRDVGDPFTTYLAKSIAIALRYRSLFRKAVAPLADPDSSEAMFEQFLKTTEVFCAQTKAIHVAFTTKVLQRLAGLLQIEH